jgi:hypothetical protein
MKPGFLAEDVGKGGNPEGEGGGFTESQSEM